MVEYAEACSDRGLSWRVPVCGDDRIGVRYPFLVGVDREPSHESRHSRDTLRQHIPASVTRHIFSVSRECAGSGKLNVCGVTMAGIVIM